MLMALWRAYCSWNKPAQPHLEHILAAQFEDASYRSLPTDLAGSAGPSEEDVIAWLQECNNDTIVRVLQDVANARPTQVMLVAEAIARTRSDQALEWRAGLEVSRGSTVTWQEQEMSPRGLFQPALDATRPSLLSSTLSARKASLQERPELRRDFPLVQFSSLNYYSNEFDRYVDVDVLRIGCLDMVSEVRYATRDLTARAGRTYVALEGLLVFAPGDEEKSIRIFLIDNEIWDPTLEFVVGLLQEGITNAQLEWHYQEAIVKVLDDDAFPTNAYRDEIIPVTSESLEELPMWSLLFEYFRMNWADSVLRWGTIKMLLVDFFRNMYFILKLLASQYVLDCVLNVHYNDENLLIPSNRKGSLILLVGLLVLPLGVLHFLDHRKYTWRVAGIARSTLQKAVVRKYFVLEDGLREEIDPTVLNMAVMRDAPDLVTSGYMNMIKLVGTTGQLLLILAYQVIVPPLVGKPIRFRIMIITTTCILITLSFLRLRRSKTLRAFEEEYREQVLMADYVHMAAHQLRLVLDYSQQSSFMEGFQGQVDVVGRTIVQVCQVQENNIYCAPWVSNLAAGAYIFFEGMLVIDGQVPLGVFLMEAAIIVHFGKELGRVYHILVELQTTLAPLKRLIRLLNVEVDVTRRMYLNQLTHTKSKSLREKLHSQGVTNNIFDHLPILVGNIRDAYGSFPRKSLSGRELSETVEIPQGALVTFVGHRGEGKSTLLKVVGGVILPRIKHDHELVLFMPGHLRVLHVSQEPLFFRGSLFENLVYGLGQVEASTEMPRVLKICERLGIPEDVLRLIENGKSVDRWSKVLSHTAMHLIHLARALVSNFEVLCVHKPTLAFDESTSRRVMELLVEFVRERGVLQDPATTQLRRPRTCLTTSSKLLGLDFADVIFHVSRASGIQQLTKDEVSPELLC